MTKYLKTNSEQLQHYRMSMKKDLKKSTNFLLVGYLAYFVTLELKVQSGKQKQGQSLYQNVSAFLQSMITFLVCVFFVYNYCNYVATSIGYVGQNRSKNIISGNTTLIQHHEICNKVQPLRSIWDNILIQVSSMWAYRRAWFLTLSQYLQYTPP